MDAIKTALAADPGLRVTPKLFRAHRDVRFSKDKRPYNTNLHLLWQGADGAPGCFFGISPDYVKLGGGVMGLKGASLTAWRVAVAGPSGDVPATEIAALLSQGFTLNDPDLKRVPAPYQGDHPREDFLRRKSVTLWFDLPEAQ